MDEETYKAKSNGLYPHHEKSRRYPAIGSRYLLSYSKAHDDRNARGCHNEDCNRYGSQKSSVGKPADGVFGQRGKVRSSH